LVKITRKILKNQIPGNVRNAGPHVSKYTRGINAASIIKLWVDHSNFRQRIQKDVRRHRSLAELVLYLSLPVVFLFLIVSRPPLPFYVTPLAPIALAAVLYEFAGGTLVALVAIAAVGLLLALDPDIARRSTTLQAAWPILATYLAVGPAVGWLAARERERDRRLVSAERRWSRHLADISDACREIVASLDLERALQLVMAKAVETLPMDAGALFQFDAALQAYRVVVSHALSPEHVAQITFAFEEGVPGWVVKHRQPLIIPDAAADARVHPYVVEDGVQSVLAAPLIAREQVVGVLNLYCKSGKNAFDDEARRLAEIFGAQIAVAIENARLMEELRRATAELEARVDRRTRQLRETQAQIIRTEKLAVVGRLASSVAHEVNNPLQAIALQLQLIADEGLTEPAGQRLSIVQEELARIAGIVQRLLDFQRPTPGERAPHDVAVLLDEVLSLASKQLQQHGIEVIRQASGGLKPVVVAGDQLKQVFLNLVLNAIQAMPRGGQLHVKVEQVDNVLEVHLTDTGVGMTPAVMDHLFEPFFSTKTNGTGLGLAVSHEIVTQNGGTLAASSKVDQGSTFIIQLPLYDHPPAHATRVELTNGGHDE
jgi:two-component system, NtrC family, sensor kinase